MAKFKIIFLSLFSIFQLASAQQSTQKKNVLFIIADDLNCNLSSYDHYLVKTPNIDKLAAEGMLFENAYCNFPWCGPSRASMMTGLYPDQTGHKALRDLVRDHVPDVTTMSQNFMNQGYTAVRVGKIFHYNNPGDIGTPGHDDPASWNERYYPKGRDKEEEDRIFSLVPGSFGGILSWYAADGTDEEQTDGMVATESIKLLERYGREKNPFFLAVGFYKPHTPYVSPKKYFELYPKDKIRIPDVPENYLSTLPEPAKKELTRVPIQYDISDSLALCAIQAYYAAISFLDAQVGRVLQALEENGLKESTIVVFTSDHGYHMGEHGYYMKRTLFEDADRIPMIISYPGMKTKNTRTHAMVEMVDLYPTLSDLAGISIPPYLAGKSMVPVLKNKSSRIRQSALTQIGNGYTLRTADYRYSRWESGGPSMIELYDRRKDPAEMKNIAQDPKNKSIILKLDKLLSHRVAEASVAPVGLTVKK
jgi:choline-sulfatase